MSTHHPSFGRSSGLGNVFKSWTTSLKSSPSKDVPVKINPTVIGGGSDQKKLFLQLQKGPLPQRASTAAKMIEVLEKYSISSIPEVWYLARDMCDPRIQSYIRRVALKLMIECIKHDDLTATSSKLVFYKDILLYCRLTETKVDQEFDLFLKAVRNLTQNGRDIHDLCMYNGGPNLSQWLMTALSAMGKVSRNYSTKESAKDVETDLAYQNLVNTLVFIKDCFKFNANIMDESYINEITKKTIYIGSRTNNVGILTACLDLLYTIVIFTSLEQPTLFRTIEFFCSVYGSNVDLTKTAWNAIATLASHGTFYVITSCLCDIITNEELQSFRSTDADNVLSAILTNGTINTMELKYSNSLLSSCIGAIQVIERLIISPTIINSNDTAFIYFLPALREMTTFNVPAINTPLLRTLDRLFSKESYQNQSNVNVNNVMAQIYLFQLWYSSKGSIYDLLNNVKLSSDIDVSYWGSICSSLQTAYENHELHTPKEKLINLFSRYYQYLPKLVVKFIFRYYTEERLCTVFNPLWQEHCMKLINYFYHNQTPVTSNFLVSNVSGTDPEIRLEVLKTIKHGYKISYSVDQADINADMIINVLKKSVSEDDPNVLAYLVEEFFVDIIAKTEPSTMFQLFDIILPYFEISLSNGRIRSLVSVNSSDIKSGSQVSHEPMKTGELSNRFKVAISQGIAKVLLIESTRNPQKALEAFKACILIAQHALTTKNTPVLLVMLKILIRLRVSSNNLIYFTYPADMEGLANAFGRNVLDPDYKENDNFQWRYPENVDFLDERYYDKPCQNLRLFSPKAFKLNVENTMETIDIEIWFSIVLDITENFVTWEVYSFVWAHFCPQLANMKLFDSKEQLLRLKKIICDLLTLNLPSSVTIPETFSKSQLQVVFVRNLSGLIGYRGHFSKYDEDDIIRSLIVGIDSWERTAIPCIHILTVCCYELPLSVKKYLSNILTKFQTRISSTFASSHILEFLMALINIPTLTSNFDIDEVKRIFGIAFKFVQQCNDLLKNTQVNKNTDPVMTHGLNALIDNTPSTQNTTEHSGLLSQYVLTLSYNIISTWFLKIDMPERKKLSSFLLKNLVALNSDPQKLEPQIIAYVDLIIRFTYNDLPLKIVNPKVALDAIKAEEGTIQVSSWLMGYTVVTIATNTEKGDSVLILRRPTGVSIHKIQLDKDLIPALERFRNRQILFPSYLLLQGLDTLDAKSKLKPLPLLDDSTTTRALSTFDRIPIVEFHKIGILYIGKGQGTEAEVLANNGGSRDYQTFINSIGHLIKLRNCKDIYVGGLDIENGTDGDYALYWNDKTVQVVYHSTTLMPNSERDVYYDYKKRHIGNNYINIYFDESERPFNFNIIKSQFNFINIVIAPHTKSFNVYEHDSGDSGKKFFKVKLFRRSGVPGVFATCHFKIISEELLPAFVRNLAITANQFANVWHASYHGAFVSNWTHRVKQIDILKERTMQSHEQLKQEQFHSKDTKDGVNDATQSFLQQLEFNVASANNDSQHRYEYLTDSDNPLYAALEFNSFT